MEKTALKERGQRLRRRVQHLSSICSQWWMESCLWSLRMLAPWRFHWASMDLTNLRRFYPTVEPQLPLPICMQGLPTIVPPTMVPAVHLLLALLDVVMLPWMLLQWFYVSEVGRTFWLRLLWPSLTIRRQVPPEKPVPGAWQALQALRQSLVEWLPREFVWRQVALLHSAILCLSYMLVSSWWSWRVFRRMFIVPFLKSSEGYLERQKMLAVFIITCLVYHAFGVIIMKAISKLRSHMVRAPKEMSIRSQGFRGSTAGMLGGGVYISRDLNKVWGYGGAEGAICELQVSVGRIQVIDRQHHPKQKVWRSEADTAYVPYRCGMVPSGLEEACVANEKRLQLVRVWDKNLLGILLIYDLVRNFLDQLLWMTCFVQLFQLDWHKWLAIKVPPQRANDLELCMEVPNLPLMEDAVQGDCWHHKPHAMMPPALVKKCITNRMAN